MHEQDIRYRLDALERETRVLRAIIEEPIQYPKGITLEFSDDGERWLPGEFDEFYSGGADCPWVMHGGGSYRYARYPINWSMLAEQFNYIIEFDSGVKLAWGRGTRWKVGEESAYGTVIHIERRTR